MNGVGMRYPISRVKADKSAPAAEPRNRPDPLAGSPTKSGDPCTASRAASQFTVPAKKAGIGIGVPKHSCDVSRSLFRRVPAAYSFAPPVFGGSGREPQGSPVSARSARYANLSELPPSIGVEVGGFCKTALLGGRHG